MKKTTTVREAAEIIGRSVDWVKQLIYLGRIKAEKNYRGDWMIDAGSLKDVTGLKRGRPRKDSFTIKKKDTKS